MVIVHIEAGLGNQLFQYAFGRSLALKMNTKLKLDITATETEFAKKSHHSYYFLDEFNIKEKTIASKKELDSINPSTWKILNGKDMPKISSNDNVYVEGSWLQKEDFFVEHVDIIRREFTLKNPLHKVSASWKKKICSAECPVSIHIRHGDYMTPYWRCQGINIIPMEYYFTCLNELKKYFPKITAFVFSDDLNWAKENLKLDVPTEFVEGCEKDVEEMYLMSLCHHNIIAHSTFSFWSAWLNKNPDKKVFCPPTLGEALKSWIKVPIDYSKISQFEEIPPTLSIIVYVNDDISTVEFTMLSILSQRVRDFEIIIVDTSRDGSGRFCRQFTSNDNVTILTPDRSTNKYAAFNMGINYARGSYVLLLTGKDFIISNTVISFFKILEDYFRKFTETRENYTNYSNYEKLFIGNCPNIISYVKRLEEDINGNVNLSNKKFSVKGDTAFINLAQVDDIVLDKFQKLNFIAEQRINVLLGTKFFKRSFLNENKIRFIENVSIDSDIIFLVNAMLTTEKITCVPDIFYGQQKS